MISHNILIDYIRTIVQVKTRKIIYASLNDCLNQDLAVILFVDKRGYANHSLVRIVKI